MAVPLSFLNPAIPVPGQFPDGAGSIKTSGSFTTEELITDIFVKGTCENIFNIKAIGHPDGIGYFENGEEVIGIDRGIILSTGPIRHAEGPNRDTDKSGTFDDPRGDPDLNLLSGSAVKDAVGLEFDFVPLDSVVTFRYVFASEEYCEFVGSIFNDVFGFFISGPGIEGEFSSRSRNVALIPGTDDFVAINSVNHTHNPDFFVRNDLPEDARNCMIPEIQPPFREGIQFDGFTKELTATLRLIPCETYRLRLVIADVGDFFYDSAVFLEAESFNIGGNVRLSAKTSSDLGIITEGCSDGYFLFERVAGEKADFPLEVPIEVSPVSSAKQGIDFETLPASITIPAGQRSYRLPVNALYDGRPDSYETLILQLAYPCECISDTARMFIIDPPTMRMELPEPAVCENAQVELAPQIQGGAPPFTYSWNTAHTDSSLLARPRDQLFYSVTVTDACGQVVSDSITLNPIPAPIARFSGYAEICEGDFAVFPVTFTGEPPWRFSYTIDGIPAGTVENIRTNPFPWEASKAGVFAIEGFSDARCNGPAEGLAEVVLTSLNIRVQSKSTSCYNGSDGKIAVEVTGGHPPYSYSWDQGLGRVRNPEQLSAGVYNLTVTDQRGCTASVPVTVTSPEPLGGVQFDCGDLAAGNLAFSARGGTRPYRYSIDGKNFMDGSIFQELTVGETYDLLIRDAAGCELRQPFLMPYSNREKITLEPGVELKLGDPYTFRPTLLMPQNLISRITWTPDLYLSCSDCLNPVLTAFENLKYTVRITDRFGCTDDASINVRVDKAPNIFVPSAFSPNGDQVNDILLVFADATQVSKIRSFRIFNRWGGVVFERQYILPNDPAAGWDGYFNGTLLDSGIFIYQIEAELINGAVVLINGDVMLLR